MHPEPPVGESDFARDVKTFEQLPAKTKELVILKDEAEKTSGPECAALNTVIREKSKPPIKPPRSV